MLLFLLPLLALFSSNFGTSSHAFYISYSELPLRSFGREGSLKHVSAESIGELFSPFLTGQMRHNKYLSPAPGPAPSQVSQGPFTSRKRWHHHRQHKTRAHAVSPSASTSLGCGQTCTEPLVSSPFGSPCMCVIPMRVRLLLELPSYAIFPMVTELEIEVAAGTYLKQSQIEIIGASADSQDQERTVVDVILVPLGEKFDDTTATLTYQRFLHKNVLLNRTLFGDYSIMNISYPGLPSSLSSGESPTGSPGNKDHPISAEFVGKNPKLNPRIIIVTALSALVLLVVACAVVAILLKCKTAHRPFHDVDPVFAPSMKKRSGIGSIRFSSPPTSTSPSLISAMPASVLSMKTYSLVELEKATEKFSPKKLLGEGGFGRVYLGVLQDGNEVAVKLLMRDNNQNGDQEFIAEIEMLSRLHHRNLVKLIGICIEKKTRCLVYELVPNGSVESHLHGEDRGKLDWDARLKIALGAARGLAYLHEDSNPRVIHRDFKASNVLLEDDFTPKVSDFGLAREATEGSDHISTRVMGTFGYVAPEYAMTGHLLVKSDVYSYGVVLLELLSGKKPVDMSQPPGQESLVTWARPLLTNREGLEKLRDPSLGGTYDFNDMAKVAAIAYSCVHPEVNHRPFMGEVVQALKLIYNDTDETCADGFSLKESSACDSDYNGDLAPSDGSWWNAGYGRASIVTMGHSSGPMDEVENRVVNRSGPLRTVRSKGCFYRLQGSVSEHGEIRGWNDGGDGYDGLSF